MRIFPWRQDFAAVDVTTHGTSNLQKQFLVKQLLTFFQCSLFQEYVGGLNTTLDKKKNHPRDSRREERCSTCDIMLDQARSAQGKSRGSDLPCTDRAWSSMISHGEQRSSRRESRWWFFFLSRVVGPNRGSGARWVYGSEVCALPPRSFVPWLGLLPDFLASSFPSLSLSLTHSLSLSPPPSLLLLFYTEMWSQELGALFLFSDPIWLALAPRQCLKAWIWNSAKQALVLACCAEGYVLLVQSIIKQNLEYFSIM